MHFMGINKQVVRDNIFQQYASAYEISRDQLEQLPDTDPLKAKIMDAANTIYNQQSFSQTLW